MKIFTVDEVYDIIGHLGYVQLIYIFCLGMLQIFTCHHMLLNIFTGLSPSFLCLSKIQPSTGENDYLQNRCFNDSPGDCILKYNNSFTSIASEWNLVCSQKYKVAAVQSIWMGGVMTGALFLGGVADHIGRLKTLMLSIIGTIMFEGFSAFASGYKTYTILRFFGGMNCSVIIIASFVLCQEIVGAKRRSLVGIGTSVFFSFGIVTLSLLASYIRLWQNLTLVTSLMGLIFIFIPFYVPESPRWLVSQGKLQEAKVILEMIGRKNGTFKFLPKHWNLGNTDISSKNSSLIKKKDSVLALFGHPYVLKLTVIQIFSWFVNSAVYYALTMAAGNMKGNVYFSTALNGLVEIPANLSSIIITDRYGRRAAICGFMLFGGSMCLMAPLVAFVNPHFITVLFLAGKLSISASFSVIYIHSGEIFPTQLRNTGIGIVSVAARIGGIVAPFILMLDDVKTNLHFTVLGLLTLLAGLCNMKLPETLGCPMPETVADIINLRNHPKLTKSKGYSALLQDEKEEIESEFVAVSDRCNIVPSVHGKR